jgi:hypothetical protein
MEAHDRYVFSIGGRFRIGVWAGRRLARFHPSANSSIAFTIGPATTAP